MAVLVPALDEEEALPEVLRALEGVGVGEVVVVDNGSRDGTARVAREGGATVVVEPRRGYGAACLRGLERLRARAAPPGVVAFVDADHPEDAARLPSLVAPVLEGQADLVLGARTSPGGGRGNVHRHARLGNRLILALVRILFGVRFRDLGPFRAVSLPFLEGLEMDDRDWGWTLQMQIRAVRAGGRIVEVDVPHHPRTRGRSKISGSLSTSVRVGLRMLYTLARERLRGA